MLRAKLAGRVNYPGSLHLNGWMSSALARRMQHQFKKEGEANRKFRAGGAWHCFEPIFYSTALPLLSIKEMHSLHLCLCWRAASTPSPDWVFPLFSTIHWELAFRLPAGCPPLAPACGMLTGSSGREEHLSRALLSLFSAGTEMRVLGWAFAAQLKPPCATREVRSPSLLLNVLFKPHLYNLWNISDKESMFVPWRQGQLLFYFQQLLWKQLVLHELFAFQS